MTDYEKFKKGKGRVIHQMMNKNRPSYIRAETKTISRRPNGIGKRTKSWRERAMDAANYGLDAAYHGAKHVYEGATDNNIEGEQRRQSLSYGAKLGHSVGYGGKMLGQGVRRWSGFRRTSSGRGKPNKRTKKKTTKKRPATKRPTKKPVRRATSRPRSTSRGRTSRKTPSRNSRGRRAPGRRPQGMVNNY